MPELSLRSARSRIVIVALIVLSTTLSWSASYKVLYTFNGRHAENPSSGLVLDKAGNAYGTTAGGGFHHGTGGTVYQISPTTGFHLIYGFSGPDGLQPQGNVTIDDAGNLYGTTVYGGSNSKGCNNLGCGTVFMLSPPVNGGAWTETVLYSFSGGADGSNPQASVILDSAGNLFGTTKNGGDLGAGTVFELSEGGNGEWTESVIYSMSDGAFPLGGVIFDELGNLYGTTSLFGGGAGTVFALAPPQSGGTWTYSRLYSFGAQDGNDGLSPAAGVLFDSSGNLYGTTSVGGDFGQGTVFQLSPGQGGKWNESILHSFAGGTGDGANPQAALILDEAGNLFGTTLAGGGHGCFIGCGTIFELMPGQNGQWSERRLSVPFKGDFHNGAQPTTPLLLDESGRIYGTMLGGSEGDGVVFQLTP